MVITEGSKAKGNPKGSTEAAGAHQVHDMGPPGNSLNAASGDYPFNPPLHNKSRALRTASRLLA